MRVDRVHALSALAGAGPTAKVLGLFGIHNSPILDAILRVVSVMVSFLLSWVVFGWMIARLPREPVDITSAIQAALLAAVGFEIFKLIASIYLRSVLHSPAGATFGPVLGLMVFAYVTARLLLFATAWAATAPENLAKIQVEPPAAASVVITPRAHLDEQLVTKAAVAAAAVGAAGALGVSRLIRRRKS